MDKDTIVAEARRLTDAAEQAQQWIARNEERVRSCGKSREDVLAKLRQQARLLRKLGRAAERKMCAGVFGPSQAGKSDLLSSLARDENKEVRCAFGDQTYDFLRDLNPGGNKESTGLVTRFTMTPPANMPAGYPVHVRLLSSETELVKVFANSYFCDCDHKEKVDKAAIQAAVSSLKERAGAAVRAHHARRHGGAARIREQFLRRHEPCGRARRSVLARCHCACPAPFPRRPRDALRHHLGRHSGIQRHVPGALFGSWRVSATPRRRSCSMDALVPREASIIDVDTLGRTDFSLSHVSGEVQMCTPEGRKAAGSAQERLGGHCGAHPRDDRQARRLLRSHRSSGLSGLQGASGMFGHPRLPAQGPRRQRGGTVLPPRQGGVPVPALQRRARADESASVRGHHRQHARPARRRGGMDHRHPRQDPGRPRSRQDRAVLHSHEVGSSLRGEERRQV